MDNTISGTDNATNIYIYVWIIPFRVRIMPLIYVYMDNTTSGTNSRATGTERSSQAKPSQAKPKRTSGYSTFSICSNDTLPPFSPVAYLLLSESPARPARRRHLDWHGCHICAGTSHICAGTARICDGAHPHLRRDFSHLRRD